MFIDLFVWDPEDDPEGNVQHIPAHGITTLEVEHVLTTYGNIIVASRSSGRPLTFGRTSRGRLIGVVWEAISRDPLIIRPITSFDVE